MFHVIIFAALTMNPTSKCMCLRVKKSINIHSIKEKNDTGAPNFDAIRSLQMSLIDLSLAFSPSRANYLNALGTEVAIMILSSNYSIMM